MQISGIIGGGKLKYRGKLTRRRNALRAFLFLNFSTFLLPKRI